MRTFFIGLAFQLLALAGFSQTEALTTTNLSLRDSASATSAKVAVIPQGAHISVGDCSGGWCEASYAGEQGYVSERYVTYDLDEPTKVRTQPTSGVRYYTNVDGNRVQSPTHYNNGPPAGASAVCRDGTYSFSQNHRGTCSHHGGVSRWLD